MGAEIFGGHFFICLFGKKQNEVAV